MRGASVLPAWERLNKAAEGEGVMFIAVVYA